MSIVKIIRSRRIEVFITFTVIIMAVIGSAEYYSAYVTGVPADRFAFTVIFSVIGLFTIQPTVPVGIATPLIFELARLLAPVCTLYWLFSFIESMFHHAAGIFERRLYTGHQIAVIGYAEHSKIFLQNLISENRLQKDKMQRRKITLITDYEFEMMEKRALEEEDVLIYAENADRPFGKFHPEEMEEIVLFQEDPGVNFTWLSRIGQHIAGIPAERRRKVINCAVYCEDKDIRSIFADYHDSLKVPELRLNIFGINDMITTDLLGKAPVYGNCLEVLQTKLAEAKRQGKELTAAERLSVIPQPHVVIAGFGRCGQELLEKVLISGSLTTHSAVTAHKRLRITIIDIRAGKARNIVETRYPAISRICDITYIDDDIRNISAFDKLAELPQPGFIAICIPDGIQAVRTAKRFIDYTDAPELMTMEKEEIYSYVTIAVRAETEDEMAGFLSLQYDPARARLTLFGNENRILTHDHLFRYGVEEDAEHFNDVYQHISAALDPDMNITGWDSLSYEKKESSRAQALNRPYFSKLISLLPELPAQEEIIHPWPVNDELMKKLTEYPVLDELAGLEHQRWDNFSYSQGYIGYTADRTQKGKVHVTRDRDFRMGKVHPTLIDDWAEMKQNAYAAGTIIYDLCGIYGYSRDRSQ